VRSRTPAILLDRDGVVNRRLPEHVRSWSDFEFLPRSLAALRLLRGAGARVVILTNQSVVGHGLIDRAQLDEIHRRMREAVERAGGLIEAVLACPHAPRDGCGCRKPATGLFLRAEAELHVDLPRSVMIGDSRTDVEAARAAGCDAVWVRGDDRTGAAEAPVATDLLHAVALLGAC
jgi:D-glycero-D-manno-heptose 1,7-bisphosphate phosphatase